MAQGLARRPDDAPGSRHTKLGGRLVTQHSIAPIDDRPLGFLYNHGGLNNQRMALAGLLLHSIAHSNPVKLPFIYLKDQRTTEERIVDFESVFDPAPLGFLTEKYGLEINLAERSGERGGWNYFNHFNKVLAEGATARSRGRVLDVVGSITPHLSNSEVVQSLKRAVFDGLGVGLVLQLRIEADWADHVVSTLDPALARAEQYDLNFTQIIEKTKASLPDVARAYVVCDEKSMPATKDEIRSVVDERFGIGLIWKSDILQGHDIEALTDLELSIVDFEVAKHASRFVGLTNSTFSNYLAIEKYARTGSPVRGHYIYNYPGPLLVERVDSGFAASARLAAVVKPELWADERQPHPSASASPADSEVKRVVARRTGEPAAPEFPPPGEIVDLHETSEIELPLERTLSGISARREALEASFLTTDARVFQGWNPAPVQLCVNLLFDVVVDGATGVLFKGRAKIRQTSYLSDEDFGRLALNAKQDELIPPFSPHIVVCAFNAMHGNHYHWIAQCLPAIDACVEALGKAHVCIALPRMTPTQRDCLRLLGYHSVPVLTVEDGKQYRVGRAAYSTFASGAGSFAISRSARRTYGRLADGVPPEASPQTKIYVSRTDAWSRRMVNEAEVIEYLTGRGYQIVLPGALGLEDQIRTFRGARVVIGPHGAGLSNIVFCDAGTIVYELVPDHFQNSCFCNLAVVCELDYVADGFRSDGEGPANFREWRLDIAVLRPRIEEIERRLENR